MKEKLIEVGFEIGTGIAMIGAAAYDADPSKSIVLCIVGLAIGSVFTTLGGYWT